MASKTEELKIGVDLDAMTFGDLDTIILLEEKRANDEETLSVEELKEFMGLLKRVITNDIRTVPISAFPDVVSALTEAMAQYSKDNASGN